VVVLRQPDRVLMDRAALAQWTGRSVHTIRLRCAVVDRGADNRALYDATASAELLRSVPARQRQQT